jgi:hypothetical protein
VKNKAVPPVGHASPSASEGHVTILEEQLAANAALVEQRETMGDLSEYPRSLDHMAYFPKRGVDDAQVALRSAGFHVDSVKKGLRRAAIEFSREDTADLATANAFTREIVAIVDEHGGTYDGWAGFMLTEPPAN